MAPLGGRGRELRKGEDQVRGPVVRVDIGIISVSVKQTVVSAGRRDWKWLLEEGKTNTMMAKDKLTVVKLICYGLAVVS